MTRKTSKPAKTAKVATPRPRKPAAAPRRKQADRSDATRKRLIDATLYCLAHYGYAGTGVSQIVARARVSRGAWGHHYASMNALMLDAAQQLVVRVYERLAALSIEVGQSENRVHAFIHRVWQEFFASEVNTIYLELLIASRRDAQLAKTLAALTVSIEQRLNAASELYFASQPQAAIKVRELMMIHRWMMRGMAIDAHLVPAATIEHHLEAWRELILTQMHPRSMR